MAAANGHGGPRTNAGRKKGAKTRKRRPPPPPPARPTPVEVMEKAMWVHYDAGEWDQAAAIAKDCAPYRHPRLAAVTVRGDAEHPVRLVEELVIVDANADPAPPAAP